MFHFNYQRIWVIYLVTTYSIFTLPEPVFGHRSVFVRNSVLNRNNNATASTTTTTTTTSTASPVAIPTDNPVIFDDGTGVTESSNDFGVVEESIKAEESVISPVSVGAVVEERAPLLAGVDNVVAEESIHRFKSRPFGGPRRPHHLRPSKRPHHHNLHHQDHRPLIRDFDDEPRSLEKPILLKSSKFRTEGRKPLIHVPKIFRNSHKHKPSSYISRPHHFSAHHENNHHHSDRERHHDERERESDYERFRRPAKLPTRIIEEESREREREREERDHPPESPRVPVVSRPNPQSIAETTGHESSSGSRSPSKAEKHQSSRSKEYVRSSKREKVKEIIKPSQHDIQADFFPSAVGHDSATSASSEKMKDIREFVKPANLQPSPSTISKEPPFYRANRPAEGYLPTNDKEELKDIFQNHHLRRTKDCNGVDNFIYDLNLISFFLSLISSGFGLYTDIIPFFNDGVKISYGLDQWGDGEDFPHDYWPKHDAKIDTGRTISIGTKEDEIKDVLSVIGEFIGILSLGINFVSLFPSWVEKFFYSLDWWFGKRGLWKQYLYTYKCEVHTYPQPGWGKLGR